VVVEDVPVMDAPVGDVPVEAEVDGSDRDTGADASVDSGPKTCASALDCGQNEFCSKTACSAEKGVCTPKPTTCATLFEPVCGCDKVSYWTNCTRQAAGVESAVTGECGNNTATCGGIGSIQCPSAASCIFLFSNATMCNTSDQMGRCWLVPAGGTCPTIVIGGQWRACVGVSVGCLDVCRAILKGQAHYLDNTCPV
jgi:hypothetical protein